MPDVKVMVVDDSAAMRALFCDILDNAKGVIVCGVACDASEARAKIPECRPDVLTLDVEMPGISGMEFLEELMGADDPLPVIMLSSIAQAGSGTAQKALELGAVHCFPKPLHSSREEFDATVKMLGGIVLKAAAGELGGKPAGKPETNRTPGSSDYRSNGAIVVIACGKDGLAAASKIASSYPLNGPATVLVADAETSEIDAAIRSDSGTRACGIEHAQDNVELTPGTFLIASDPSRHAIIEAGEPPRLRLVQRDPVAGARPSADLLLGSVARAKMKCIAGVLPGSGSDGAKGLQMIGKGGGQTFVLSSAEASERQTAVAALANEANELAPGAVGPWIIEQTNAC